AGGIVRCDIQEVCVVARQRQVHLDRSGGDWAIRITDENTGTPAVEGITVEELLARCNAPETIDLLKCDIEGAEAEVFADCSAWIGRVHYLIIEVHPPYSSKALIAQLEKNGAHPQLTYRRDKGNGLEMAVLKL
ncbi:methyltransferase FkbM family, partial [mine drainage metagenome]